MSVGLERESGTSVLGNVLVFVVAVRDLDGDLSGAVTPTITITPPSGPAVNPVPESTGVGLWRFTYTLAAAGRHLVVANAGSPYGQAITAVWCDVTTAAGQMPVVADWQEYAGGELEFSWSDDQIAQALAAESAAQRARLKPSAIYGDDIREALFRRVTCNLARRGLPLGVQSGDSDRGPLVVPLRDPEVRRLEAPYRKLVIG
jgi:hypothetical protein